MPETVAIPAGPSSAADRGFALLSAAAAVATSLAVPPGSDLWAGLAAPYSNWQAGLVGIWFWKKVWITSGMPGLEAVRAALVLASALAFFREVRGSGPLPLRSRLERLVALCAFGALFPWGPGALTLPLLAISYRIASGSRRLGRVPAWILAAAICFLWPWVDSGFIFAVPLVALCWWASNRADSGPWRLLPLGILLPAFANPSALASLWRGEAFAPLLASWVDPSGFATPMPNSPAFWLVFLPVLALFYRFWRSGPGLAATAWASLWGFALRPLAGLPASLWLADEPTDRDGGEVRPFPAVPLWASLALVPALVWSLMAPAPQGLPGRAGRLLDEIRPGGWTLLVEPAWRGECALLPRAGDSQVLPDWTAPSLLGFRERHPTGLLPPFEGNPEPGADFLLLRPDYPAARPERPLLPGWRLLSAGERYALFGKAGGRWAPWVEGRALRHYSPFAALPEEEGERRLALKECRAVALADPRFFQAVRDAGRLETDFRRLDEAVRHFEAAIRLRPEDSEVRNDLAVALQLAGRADEARAAYLKSIALNPQELLPRLNLAGWAMEQGKPDEAEFVLRDILKGHPGFIPARRLLIRVLLAQKRGEEARAEAGAIPADSRGPEELDLLQKGGGP